MTLNGQAVDTVSSYSLGWESFSSHVCAQNHQAGSTAEKVVKTDEYTDVSAASDDSSDDIDDAEKGESH